jgi:uncharacterized Zn finger protein
MKQLTHTIIILLLSINIVKAQKEIPVKTPTGGIETNTQTPCLIQSLSADQDKAVKICNKTDYVANAFGNSGTAKNEINIANSNLKETHTQCLSFQVAIPGNIEFTITPQNENDDIDFVLYQLMPTASMMFSKYL